MPPRRWNAPAHLVRPVPPPPNPAEAIRAEASGGDELATQVFVGGRGKVVEVLLDVAEHRVHLARLEAIPPPPDML